MDHAYQDALAYIHDAGFGMTASAAARLLLDTLQHQGFDHGLVVDLGCGSGILSAALAAAGYDILGIDISPSMIELARQRTPKGEFRVDSFVAADLRPCVAVAAVGEIFNYLFDESHSQAALIDVFRRVAGALLPGGVFLFDVAVAGRLGGALNQRRFFEGDDWAVLVTATENPGTQRLRREITSFRRITDLYERDHEVHELQLWDPTIIEDQLQQLGFQVTRSKRYDDLELPPGLTAFVARKPAVTT